MNELGQLLQILLVLAATATTIILVVRLIGARGTDEAIRFLDSHGRLPWPQGVQEEEPLPWKFGPASS